MLVVAGDCVSGSVLLLIVIHHHLDVELGQSLSRQADTDVASADD